MRAARRTAESIASGNLGDRMPVRGQDDLARLAASMNYMASELEKQITTLGGAVGGPAAVRLRRLARAADPADHGADGRRGALRGARGLRPGLGPVGRADADRAGPVRGAAHRPAGDLPVRRRRGRAQCRRGRPERRSSARCWTTTRCWPESHAASRSRCTASGEAKAEVDARRIERILRNLVVNAIEHSEGRPIEILVASDQLAVAVAVRDHGVGFEASQAKQVFHRFWRADPARARTVGGSGLGLAIAMEDANLHGGWLTAWGRPGLGAQFRLTLPRRLGAWCCAPRRCPWCPATWCHAGSRPGRPGVRRRADDRHLRPAQTARTRRCCERRGTSGRTPAARRGGRAAMTDAVRVPALLVGWSWLLAGLTGCVQVPTAGPIERVEGQAEACQNCINVEVAPPAAGDEPAGDRRGIPAGDLELPAELLHRPAVPDRRWRRSSWQSGGGSVDLQRLTRSDDETASGSTGGWSASSAPDRTYTARTTS